MTAARNLLLAAVVVAGIVGGALLWQALTRSTHPSGLLQVTLALYASTPHLEPFASQIEKPEGDKRQRLYGLSEPQARKLLSACPIEDWKPIESLRAPAGGDAEGERLFHIWACDKTSGKVIAAELWKPHMGADGVYFAACAPNLCPPSSKAFPEIRSWLGDDFEPSADRPAP
jgi:hypothetical protein